MKNVRVKTSIRMVWVSGWVHIASADNAIFYIDRSQMQIGSSPMPERIANGAPEKSEDEQPVGDI